MTASISFAATTNVTKANKPQRVPRGKRAGAETRARTWPLKLRVTLWGAGPPRWSPMDDARWFGDDVDAQTLRQRLSSGVLVDLRAGEAADLDDLPAVGCVLTETMVLRDADTLAVGFPGCCVPGLDVAP